MNLGKVPLAIGGLLFIGALAATVVIGAPVELESLVLVSSFAIQMPTGLFETQVDSEPIFTPDILVAPDYNQEPDVRLVPLPEIDESTALEAETMTAIESQVQTEYQISHGRACGQK